MIAPLYSPTLTDIIIIILLLISGIGGIVYDVTSPTQKIVGKTVILTDRFANITYPDTVRIERTVVEIKPTRLFAIYSNKYDTTYVVKNRKD